jgi:hypothetical protein
MRKLSAFSVPSTVSNSPLHVLTQNREARVNERYGDITSTIPKPGL